MLSRWLVSATPSSGLCTRCPTPHIRGPRHSSPHGATTMEARWRMTSNRRKIRNKCERCNVWAHFVRGTRWCHWFSPARPGNTRTRCDESVTNEVEMRSNHLCESKRHGLRKCETIIINLTPESLNGYPVFPGFALHDHFAIESGLRPAAKPSSQRAGARYENAHGALI